MRTGIAPLIISASRSTDIPAFHSQWFGERLTAGYCKWMNPFNQRVQYVSFARVRAFVFWSKNPAPMIPLLSRLDEAGITYYFQFTVNYYDAEGLEPQVPRLEERVATFERLSRIIGKRRVIWRFDPLFLTDTLSVVSLIDKVRHVGDLIHPFTERLVISFADISTYVKVRRNLAGHDVRYLEFDIKRMQEAGQMLSELAKQWGIVVSTCGETVDLSLYGIKHNRCIDGVLLLKLAPNDHELRDLLVRRRNIGSPLFESDERVWEQHLNDPGQREACGCIVSPHVSRWWQGLPAGREIGYRGWV